MIQKLVPISRAITIEDNALKRYKAGMAFVKPSQQIPFDLSPEKALSFETFLTSSCNVSVVSHLENWRNWPSPIWLLMGDNGTGKTHLGTAFAAQDETTLFIDDIETADETELFAHMNRALTGEVEALLLSAKTHPEGWAIDMPDLRSRLKNTPVFELPHPDDELLEGITRYLFEGYGRAVSKDVVTYIVSRTSRTVPSLQSLVQTLEQQAQSDKADMTKAYVARRINQWSEPELF